MRRGSAISAFDSTLTRPRITLARPSGQPTPPPPTPARPPTAVRRAPGYTLPVHEMGIALEIHRVCRDALREHGAGRIESVRVAVGELTAVEPDLLRFAWEAVVAGGPHAGSTLEVEWCPAMQRCGSCGEVRDRAAGSWLRICPDCGRPLEVRGGDELDVLELRFTPDDDGAAAGGPVEGAGGGP